MKPFEYFEEIYCINLERRKDRWNLCQEEFEKIGILDKVKRFDAVDNKKNPKQGCYESHMGVIRLAYEQKLKNVLIFEDDVAFLKKYDENKLSNALSYLDTQSWDFFYLGGLERRIKPRVKYNRLNAKWKGEFESTNNYIMECKSVGWAHSFAVNSCIFEQIVNDYENNIWDKLVEKYDSHLDRYYQDVLSPKTYVCVPSFTTQYNLVSDLTRTRTNRALRLSPSDNK